MAIRRHKADRQAAPQTIEEASFRLAAYLDAQARAEQLRADADAKIAAIEAARDDAVAPLAASANCLFMELRAWWAVEKNEITGGQRKSIELAGAQIGERTTPPRLAHPGLKSDDIVERLRAKGWDELVRTKRSLDKPGLIKMLQGDHADQMKAFGLDVAQREEFFIDRAQPKSADPEKVEPGEVEIREAKR